MPEGGPEGVVSRVQQLGATEGLKASGVKNDYFGQLGTRPDTVKFGWP